MPEKALQHKVLYLITKGNFGGAQRYVHDLAQDLRKDPRYDVAVAMGTNGELAERLLESGIRVIFIKQLERDIGLLKDIRALFEIARLVKQEAPDVLHLNSSKVGFLGAVAARAVSPKTRIIFTAHGWAFTEERGLFSKLALQTVQWITVLLSDKTIAVSRTTKQEMETMPFVSEKITVIYNGIKSERLRDRDAVRKELFRAHGIPERSLLIGTTAELHNNKGLPYAIHAVAKLKKMLGGGRVAYIIVGGGEERDTLSALIRSEKLSDTVFLAGPRRNAVELISAFDVFLLPSVKEGMPYVILEAGMARLPVIGTNVGGIGELLEHSESGMLCEPKNSDALADAFLHLASDKNLREKIGATLNARVSERHSLERMCSETMRCYETTYSPQY